MFKCLDCGHIFEDGEQISWTEPHSVIDGLIEHFDGCPLCRGAYEPTHACEKCGSAHLEDELYAGWCEECLSVSVTYDLFFEYLNDEDSDRDYFSEFMFDKVLDNEMPPVVGDTLRKFLEDEYFRQSWNDRLGRNTNFLSLCRKYVMDDDGDCGRCDYAEWLNRRRSSPCR